MFMHETNTEQMTPIAFHHETSLAPAAESASRYQSCSHKRSKYSIIQGVLRMSLTSATHIWRKSWKIGQNSLKHSPLCRASTIKLLTISIALEDYAHQSLQNSIEKTRNSIILSQSFSKDLLLFRQHLRKADNLLQAIQAQIQNEWDGV